MPVLWEVTPGVFGGPNREPGFQIWYSNTKIFRPLIKYHYIEEKRISFYHI